MHVDIQNGGEKLKNMQKIALLVITFVFAVILTSGAVSATNTQIAITKNTTGVSDLANVPFDITTTVTNPAAPAPTAGGATGVAVQYTLPTSFTVLSATPSAGTYWTNATKTWTVGPLATGQVQTLTLSIVGTTYNAAGFNIRGDVSDDQTAGIKQTVITPPINIDQTTVTLGGTISQASATVPQKFGKTITVTNTGTATLTNPAVAQNLQVIDVLGPNFTTILADWGASQGAFLIDANGNLVWNIGNLAPGATATAHGLLTLTGNGAGQTVTNTLRLGNQQLVNPPDYNTWLSLPLSITPTTANVKVTKTVNKTTTVPGSPVVFTITATNQGPAGATNVAITDTLFGDARIDSLVASYISQGTYAAGTWLVGNLANGATATLNLTAVFNNNALGPGVPAPLVTNWARETQDQYNKYAGADNVQRVQAAVWVIPTDLQITKTVSNLHPAVGEAFSFIVTVTNNGPQLVRWIWIADILAQFNLGLVQLSSASVTQGTLTNVAGSLPIWNIDSLAIGDSATLTLNMISSSAASGFTATNTAMIAAFNAPYGGGWYFNGVTGLPPWLIVPNLTAFLSDDASAVIGSALTVVSTNPADGATGVSLNPAITINFSHALTAIDATKIVLKLTNAPGTHINFTSAFLGNTLTLTPQTALAAGTKYTVILNSGAATSSAASLVGPYVFRFTTGTKPVVTSTNPLNNAVGVLTNPTITVTFDQAVKKATGWIQLKLTSNPGTFLTISDLTFSPNGRTVSFTPTAALAKGTKYTVIVHTGAVASQSSDIANAGPVVFRFTTGNT